MGKPDRIFKVVAFIPALNEEDSIAQCIRRVREAYVGSESRGFKVEVLVVDDGSTDRTVELARREGAYIVFHPYNLGLGAATRTGMQAAFEMGADIAVKVDADLQHPPEDIEKTILPIMQGRADIVYGSRFRGKIHYKMPLVRSMGNRFFTWLVRLVTDFPVSDAQTGLMVFSRRYLSQFTILSDYNAPQQILIDAAAKKMRYTEVPVDFNKRETGKSFVTMKYPFKVLPSMVRIIAYVNPLKIFLPISALFFLIAFGIGGWDVIRYFLHREADLVAHENTVILSLVIGIQILFFGIIGDMIARRTVNNPSGGLLIEHPEEKEN